jgi:hypothetical protein
MRASACRHTMRLVRAAGPRDQEYCGDVHTVSTL